LVKVGDVRAEAAVDAQKTAADNGGERDIVETRDGGAVNAEF
jgi:hypothetical protein